MKLSRTIGLGSLAAVVTLVGSAVLAAPASAQCYDYPRPRYHDYHRYDHHRPYYHRPRYHHHHDRYYYHRPRHRHHHHHNHGHGHWGFSIRF